MSAAKAEPVIATAARIPRAKFFIVISPSVNRSEVAKSLESVVEESGRQYCGVADTVAQKIQRRGSRGRPPRPLDLQAQEAFHRPQTLALAGPRATRSRDGF